MSRILDPVAMEDDQRRLDCAREDARLIAEMFALDPRPSHIPEADWEAADAAYLEGQRRRERDRLALLQELELAELRRAGW